MRRYLAPILMGGFLLSLIVLVSQLSFERGKKFAHSELERLNALEETTAVQIERLHSTDQENRQQIAVLQRSSQIDQQANIELRNEMAAFQDNAQSLREELALYRGIVSPGEVQPGLRLRKISIEPMPQSGDYQYDFTVTQLKNNNRYVRGNILLEADGTVDGKQKTLSLKQLGVKTSLKFKFRYFQHFDGQLSLPDKFKPEKFRVRVNPTGKRRPKAVEQTLNWSTAKSACNAASIM